MWCLSPQLYRKHGMICLEKFSFLCHKIKQRFHYFRLLSFKNLVLQHQVMSDDILIWYMYGLVCDCSCRNSWVQFEWNDEFIVLGNFISPDSNHPCYCTFCKRVSEVQILINGFIFLQAMKCFMTVDGQLEKVTDKLNWNMPITMRHVGALTLSVSNW